MPAPLLRALLGDAARLVLEGRHVAPNAALTAGYQFAHRDFIQSAAVCNLDSVTLAVRMVADTWWSSLAD